MNRSHRVVALTLVAAAMAMASRSVRVLVARREKDLFVGRTEYDAPDIDNEVFIRSGTDLAIGSFCEVDIVEAYEYDIVGIVRE